MTVYKVDLVCYYDLGDSEQVVVQLLADSEDNALVESAKTVMSQLKPVLLEVKGVSRMFAGSIA